MGLDGATLRSREGQSEDESPGARAGQKLRPPETPPGQRLLQTPDGVNDVTDSIILGLLGAGLSPAPPLRASISLSWQAGL